MDQAIAKRKRFTVVASTAVAVLILAAGVTAHNSSSPSVTPQDVTELESDLRFQINSAFRHDAFEQQRRLRQLAETLAAWDASPQSDEDRRLLADWLRESTVRSVHGRIGNLPPVPKFGVEEELLVEAESLVEAEVPVDEPLVAVKSEPFHEPIHGSFHEPEAAESSVVARENPTSEPAKIPDLADIADQATDEEFESELLDSRTEPLAEVGEQFDVVAHKPSEVETVSTGPIEPPVSINLVELTARIAGYHDALDTVELNLLKTRNPSLSALTDQVEAVNGLSRDFQFVALYYESLSARERRSILEPRSMKATVSEISRQLDRFEAEGSDDFLEPFDRDIVEQISVLRSILAEITSRIAQ